MQTAKQHAIEVITALPNQSTLEDVMAELYFKMQVDAGLEELDKNQSVDHEEVELRLSKWLTK